MPCKNPKIIWNASRYKKMELNDLLPGSETGRVTPEILEHMRSGRMGEEKRNLIRSGQYLEIACRVCTSCVTTAINSRVGSMLGESKYSPNSAFLTLTYAPTIAGTKRRHDMADQIIQLVHLREFTERIRKDKSLGKCRWFAAAERGDLYGRVHFHMILFGSDGKFPEFDYSSNLSHSSLWPYGHIHAKPMPDYKALRYCAKYSVKAMAGVKDDPNFLSGHETAVSFSKYPPIGERFFSEHGYRLADYQVPMSFRYTPPGGERGANYTVRRASRRIVANAYLDHMAEQGFDTSYYRTPPVGHVPNGRPLPLSPDIWIDKLMHEVIRERWIASTPDPSPKQLLRSIKADFRERQVKQQRINAVADERREAARVARAIARNDAFARSFNLEVGSDDWVDFHDDAADRLLGSAARHFRGV